MLLTRGAVGLLLLSSLCTGQGTVPEEAGSEDPARPRASLEGAGHGSIGVQLGFYDHSDNGDGNPFLDEDLTVIEPVIVFDYAVTDRFSWGGKATFDYVSSASIDRLSKFPDQSGATGDTYTSADLNVSYRASDSWKLGGHAGFSVEYDYTSIGAGLNATQTLDEADASITYSLDAFADDIDIIRFDGTQDEGTDTRTSISGTVGWYQILSPKSHGTFGITVAHQSGFLETPYNAVVIEDPLLPPNPNLENMARGTEITEELPADRLRTALFARVRHSVGEDDAWELGGRIYDDDWGIQSFTIEPRYYLRLNEAFDLRLRYRYYKQSESDYFQEHFTAAEEFRTQDSDLGEFDAHTLGAKLTWYRSSRSTADLSYDYTIRGDGLDYMYAAVGWNWGF